MFQFHKVRLKAQLVVAGAYTFMFQFHKVRLKELIEKRRELCNRSFNSIRYD